LKHCVDRRLALPDEQAELAGVDGDPILEPTNPANNRPLPVIPVIPDDKATKARDDLFVDLRRVVALMLAGRRTKRLTKLKIGKAIGITQEIPKLGKVGAARGRRRWGGQFVRRGLVKFGHFAVNGRGAAEKCTPNDQNRREV
jgi:hypothetical protein